MSFISRFRAPKALTTGVTTRGRRAYPETEIFSIESGRAEVQLNEREARHLSARLSGWLIALQRNREAEAAQ